MIQMSLALYDPNVLDDKNGYFGGRGNLEINHVANKLLDIFEIKANLTAFWQISALISCLEVLMYVSVSAMPRKMHTRTQIKTLSDVLGHIWQKYVRCEKRLLWG